jgi:hypothetical protein
MSNKQKLNKTVIHWWTNPSANKSEKNPYGWEIPTEEIEGDIAKGYQLGFKANGTDYIYHNKGKL